MTKEQIIRAIRKNEIILANLKENMANKTPNDNYPYESDIIIIESKLMDLEIKNRQYDIRPNNRFN